MLPDAVSVHPTWMEIDAGALRHNLGVVRTIAKPGAAIIASLKADGYGHGAVNAALILQELGVDALATGSFRQAVAMREAGVAIEILMFCTYGNRGIPELLEHRLTPTVFSWDGAHAVHAAAEEPVDVYVKVDAGLGRLGVQLVDAEALLNRLSVLERVRVRGLYTHIPFSTPEGRRWTAQRLEAFGGLLSRLRDVGLLPPVTQALGSSGVLGRLEDPTNAVSPGQMLFGLDPYETQIGDAVLRPVLSALRSELSHVVTHRTARQLGFDGAATAPAGTITGVIPFGLADGMAAAAAGRATAIVRGSLAPVLGVALEHTILDLTGVPGADVGDVATLVGRDGDVARDLSEFAEAQRRSPVEALSALSGRLSHFIVDEELATGVKS